MKYVADSPENSFDAIIVDSSDPVGPAEVLFKRVSMFIPPNIIIIIMMIIIIISVITIFIIITTTTIIITIIIIIYY